MRIAEKSYPFHGNLSEFRGFNSRITKVINLPAGRQGIHNGHNEKKKMKREEEMMYGIQPVMEALAIGRSLNKVFIQKDIHNDRIGEIISILKQREIPFHFVPKEKLARLTPKNHQGVVAMGSAIDFLSIEDILPQIFETGELPLIAILDGVTDVRNVGAIARSAECFGVQALVVPAHGSAMINADAVKSSAGALQRIPVCRELNFQRSLNYIKDSGLQFIACTEKAKQDMEELDFSAPSAIVLGAEGEGINESLLQQCNLRGRIPMVGEISSLNVSVAAGIVFYTAMRSRLRS
jgi:23S rRNA (guanosine2251-2'-O)-methyltransferase